VQADYEGNASAIDVSGHLDLCGPDLVEGWIFWASQPNTRLPLDVLIEGKLLGHCDASARTQSEEPVAGATGGRGASQRQQLPPRFLRVQHCESANWTTGGP
jgi:hypothetical protein